MRPIMIVLIVVALAAGAVAVLLLNQFMKSGTPATATNQPAVSNVVEVLVAARDILPGAVLTAEDVRWESWPESVVDARYIQRPAGGTGADASVDFVDKIARRPIMAGEPVSTGMVIAKGDGGVAAANLAAGMRAITVGVTATSGVAGLIMPNDHVDILLSASFRDLAQVQGWTDIVARNGTETIVRNVRVIATGPKMSHDPAEGVAENVSSITLEVTPAQAEQILVAAKTGDLVLALRSMVRDDSDAKKVQTYTMDVKASRALRNLVALQFTDETSLPADLSPESVIARANRPKKTEVRINRGGNVAVKRFGN